MHTDHSAKSRLLIGLGVSVLSLPACSAGVRTQCLGAQCDNVASQRPDRISPHLAWVPPSQRPDRFSASPGETLQFTKMRPDRILPAGPATESAPQPGAQVPVTVQRWVQVDLRSLGVNALVDAPEGAEARPTPTGVRVQRAPGFAIEVKAGPVDFGQRIQAIQNDTLRPLQRFVGDAHDTLLYQTGSLEGPGTVEYHFVTQLDAGGTFYSCEDARGQRFGLAEIEGMLHSCRSLHAGEGTLPAAPNPPIAPDSQNPISPPSPQATPDGSDLLP